jgi:hypothetical protein
MRNISGVYSKMSGKMRTHGISEGVSGFEGGSNSKEVGGAAPDIVDG